MQSLLPWLVRAAWALYPVAAGPAFAVALEPHDVPLRTVASVGLWALWTAGLLATLVLHPLSLTSLRLLAPAAVVATTWAGVTGTPSVLASAGAVAHAAVTMLLVVAPGTVIAFVNGPAYPNERRFPLRVPGALLAGPAFLAGALVVLLPVGAALLLADRRWVAGAAVAALGGPVAVVLARAVHGLARRWLVFVPAGVVVHDPLTLADPVLFPRAMIASLGPASATTEATDLTLRAPGLALELRLREPLAIVRARRHAAIEQEQVDALLLMPARPGAVMREAEARRLPVG